MLIKYCFENISNAGFTVIKTFGDFCLTRVIGERSYD